MMSRSNNNLRRRIFPRTAALVAVLTILPLAGTAVYSLRAQSTEPPTGPLPDLFVEEVTFTALQRPQVTIRNAGTVTIPLGSPTLLRGEWVDATGTVVQTWNSASYVSPTSIAAGAAFTATPPTNMTMPSTAQRLWITIDPNNTYTESNERNNGWEVGVPLPDLFVEEVTFTALQRPQVTIRNAGTVTIPLGSPTLLRGEWVDATGTVVQTWNSASYVSPTSIAAGAAFTATPPTNMTMPSTAQRLWITIDPNNTYTESNERNNGWEVGVTGTPSATSVSSPPSTSSSSAATSSRATSQRRRSTRRSSSSHPTKAPASAPVEKK